MENFDRRYGDAVPLKAAVENVVKSAERAHAEGLLTIIGVMVRAMDEALSHHDFKNAGNLRGHMQTLVNRHWDKAQRR